MSYGVLGGWFESLLTCRMVCFVSRQSGQLFPVVVVFLGVLNAFYYSRK